MSDSYDHWSAALPMAEDPDEFSRQADWLAQVLADRDEDEDPTVFVHLMRELGLQLEDDFVTEFGWPGFEWLIEDDRQHLWVYCEDQADLNNLVTIVQGFFRKFKPDGIFAVEWATTCSTPLLDAFGGGAVVVTATSADWFTTCDWVSKTVTVIKSRNAAMPAALKSQEAMVASVDRLNQLQFSETAQQALAVEPSLRDSVKVHSLKVPEERPHQLWDFLQKPRQDPPLHKVLEAHASYPITVPKKDKEGG